MNILLVSYKNIWPFFNKTLSLNFKNWKYLINSVIWSWKSFLFFDWPVFALYKYSTRPILNRKSNDWFIKIVFEVNWNIYLLTRFLKQTKAWWESVSSNFYIINNNIEDVNNFINSNFPELINYWVEISDYENSLVLEWIDYKLEQELQKNLEFLIPPRLVFLNTNFLMQDWDNIFDLTPIDRIAVFKNIFNLIWIDDAKDLISEERKIVLLNLKQKSDFTFFDKKLRNYISNILNLIAPFKEDYSNQALQYISELEFIKDRINILDFNFDEILLSETNNILENFSNQRTQYDLLSSKIIDLSKSIKDIDEELKKNNLEKNETNNILEKIKLTISEFDSNKINKIEEEKNILLKEKDNLVSSLKFDVLKNNWFSPNDIYDFSEIVNQLIIDWKNFSQEVSDLQIEVSKIEQERIDLEKLLLEFDLKEWTRYFDLLNSEISKNVSYFEIEKNNIKNNINFLKEKNQTFLKSIEEISYKKSEIEKLIEEEQEFDCTIIKASCPFIKNIKQKELDYKKSELLLLDEKISLLNESLLKLDYDNSLLSYESKLSEIDKNLILIKEWNHDFFKEFYLELNRKKEEISKKLEKLNYDKLKKDFIKKIDVLNSKISSIKTLLNEINWSDFKKIFEQYKKTDNMLRSLDADLIDYQKKISEISSLKEKYSNLELLLKKLEINSNLLEEKKLNILSELNKLNEKKLSLNIDMVNSNISNCSNILTNISHIVEQINDFKSQQIEINSLKNSEKRLNVLYNIFSKELMLLVLKDFLPQIEEIMNTYLSQVVDFQIDFSLVEKKPEKLELDINIIDALWARPVRSLSWWQRTILKLVWIVSISSLLKTKFLFLDETINNLDFDTIWRVSDLLEDFVKFTDIKFYVVTHSKQIQQMDIWDESIYIKN